MKISTAILIAIALLCGLLVPVHMHNVPLFKALNGAHSPISDIFWLSMTTLGDGLILGVILGAFLVVNPRITVLGLTLVITSSLVMHGVKLAFPTLRPAALLDNVHVLGPLLRSGSAGPAASKPIEERPNPQNPAPERPSRSALRPKPAGQAPPTASGQFLKGSPLRTPRHRPPHR